MHGVFEQLVLPDTGPQWMKSEISLNYIVTNDHWQPLSNRGILNLARRSETRPGFRAVNQSFRFPTIPFLLRHLVAISTLLVIISPAIQARAIGAETDAYEVLGYLKYTSYRGAGDPSYKSVMMYDVKVMTNRWLIHSEPVIEGKEGVAYYEVSLSTNGTLLELTQLVPEPLMKLPAFESLRSELEESERDDVYFENHTILPPPNLHSNPPAHIIRRQRLKPNRLNNTAVATTIRSAFPPADPSYAAFLWFSYTAPSERLEGQRRMLLQTWDDGHRQQARFRVAHLERFTQAPCLASAVSYSWTGIELLASGNVRKISVSDVLRPESTAARYEVQSTTNVNGLLIPARFSLIRFDVSDHRIVSSTIASTIAVKLLTSDMPTDVALRGKVFVSDYRLADELRGRPIMYPIRNAPPPSIESIRESSLYRHTLAAVNSEAAGAKLKWVVVLLFIAPLIPLLAFRRKRQNNKPKANPK